VFAFVLGICGVNTQCAYEYFAGHAKQSNLAFRRELPCEMIYNPEVPVEAEDHQSKDRSWKNRGEMGHCELTTLQKYCAFDAREPTKIVTLTTEYNQRKCVCGKGRAITYYHCSPGVHRCPECYAVNT
jgi:hypothetical protein